MHPPYLRTLRMLSDRIANQEFPFTLPFARPDFQLEFVEPVTMFVGENGTGKSTLLEAIAAQSGFGPQGGNPNHRFAGTRSDHGLEAALRLSWLPKVTRGFFFRAESFFNFASFIDEVSPEHDGVRELHRLSHGEAFLSVFGSRFDDAKPALYLLDEPEAALSPQRQLEFLALLDQRRRSGRSQWIIATHSPILLAYPDRDLLLFGHRGISRTRYEETPHAQLFEAFSRDPSGYLRRYIEEASAEPPA
jgi:predicted ATPase